MKMDGGAVQYDLLSGLAEQKSSMSPSELEKLEDFASQRGCSMVELAIAWLLANPSVSCVIAGATKPEQVKANAKAGDCQLTVEEKAELDAILEEHGF